MWPAYICQNVSGLLVLRESLSHTLLNYIYLSSNRWKFKPVFHSTVLESMKFHRLWYAIAWCCRHSYMQFLVEKHLQKCMLILLFLLFHCHFLPHCNEWEFQSQSDPVFSHFIREPSSLITPTQQMHMWSQLWPTLIFFLFFAYPFFSHWLQCIFDPTEINGILESKCPCSFTLRQSATKLYFIAQTNSLNIHIRHTQSQCDFQWHFLAKCKKGEQTHSFAKAGISKSVYQIQFILSNTENCLQSEALMD